MSDPHQEIIPPSRDNPSEPEPAPPPFPDPPPPAPPPRDYRSLAVGLGVGLVVVLVLVVSAPLWAPVLPWGSSPGRDDTALTERIDKLDAAQQQLKRGLGVANTASQRLDKLDAVQQQLRQDSSTAGAALERLDKRITALEAKPPPPPPVDTSDLRQQLATLSGTAASLAARVDALDKSVRSQSAGDASNMSLVLALLQIRDAVEAGRPFAAEYEALTTLARPRTDLAAAAAPLAEPAKTGVASRGVLARRLRDLDSAMAVTDDAPAVPHGWLDEAWGRVRGLVHIRRIDGGGSKTGPEAAVNAAELALAGGDLDGAVAALDKLTGQPAEAAGPWLRMARQRLAVETALRKVESLLAARSGQPG